MLIYAVRIKRMGRKSNRKLRIRSTKKFVDIIDEQNSPILTGNINISAFLFTSHIYLSIMPAILLAGKL